MGVEHLDFGDSLSGLLVDGIDGTPYVGATIRMTEDKGVVVEVPYVTHNDTGQFDHVRAWFEGQTPPVNMRLLTHQGAVSLFDITWSGYSQSSGGERASIGSLRPGITVLGNRDAGLSDALVMKEMHSWVDGLNEWSRLSSVRTTPETDEHSRVQSVTMTLDSDDSFAWRQGNATLSLSAGWLHSPEQDGYGRKTTVHNNVAIVSTFESGAVPFWDHFIEHRKVVNLMVFLFGRQLSFRKHSLRDDLFSLRTGDGRVYSVPLTEVISRGTYRERTLGIPSVKDLGRPIANLHQIGVEGLEAWAGNYELWKRYILPSVSVLGREGIFAEDLIVSTSMSMEAAAGIIGERPGEKATWSSGRNPRPTTSTYIYRCLDVLGVRWPEATGKRVGLSKAIANAYNDVKHSDRGDFPAQEKAYLVSQINQMIVRLLAIFVAGRDGDILPYYRESMQFDDIAQAFDSFGLAIAEDGKWIHTSM